MSNGTIPNIINKLSGKLTPIMEKMRQQILNSKKLNTDATSARCNSRNVSVRNYSTDNHTLLYAIKGKSKADLEKTGILPQYQGTLIHDHETVMYNYGTDHVECNVHVTRYLIGNYDIAKNKWSKDMISFLCDLNEYKKQLISIGIKETSKNKLEKYFNRYDEIIRDAREQNKKVKSITFRHEEKKLINRLEKYKDNHLKFIANFVMPFDNNLSERELQHVKTKQKISGAFNSMEGLQNYLNIKSIIITCKKKGDDFYTFLNDIFENRPVTI